MRFAPVDSAGFLRMSVANLILFEQGVAKVATLAELQSCEAWKRAFQNKCKDHRYYEIVEDTLQGGFQFRYLVLQDESGEVRAVQPVFFVRQNLVAWENSFGCRSCPKNIPALPDHARVDGRMRRRGRGPGRLRRKR